jgi:hypothetical protein
MRIIIEYCRTRELDSVLAVVDRIYCDAVNREAAKSIAVVLAASRTMPQAPDVVRILDETGTEFFRKAIGAPREPDRPGRSFPVVEDYGQ